MLEGPMHITDDKLSLSISHCSACQNPEVYLVQELLDLTAARPNGIGI